MQPVPLPKLDMPGLPQAVAILHCRQRHEFMQRALCSSSLLYALFSFMQCVRTMGCQSRCVGSKQLMPQKACLG